MSIRVRGLSFIVRGRTILNDVAFDAAPGEVVAFVGPSGAGKTSLLRILAGLALPSAGEICVLGADLKHQRIGPARADIAMVHQHLALVGRSTVAENIVCGALGKNRSLLSLLGFFPLHLRQRACSMARLAGLEPSLMSRRVETLSGGQKQRVAIARALMPRPQVLLADEPTASLDPESASAIAAALARYAHEQQAVVCFSMHHLELATSIADRLIALRRGHVVFDGNPRAFGAATREAVFGEGAP